MSSHYVLIEVLILNREGMMEIKTLAHSSIHVPGLEVKIANQLKQIEFLSATNGRTPIVHSQLVVYVVGMGAQGME